METSTNENRPEPLSQRWAIILIAGCFAGAVLFTVGGPLVAAGALGGAILGLHKVMA